MRYIGHLDIMRYFQKCIRKANVDIAYSSGFSPHQIMSFASPLGVGLESTGEYMDIEVNSGNGADIMNSLNEVMVPGMTIYSVRKLDKDAKNAMASIRAASYSVSFKEGVTVECSTDRISEFMKQNTISMIKETKKNRIEVDIKPHIFEFDYNGQAFNMLVDASSAGNVKPLTVLGEYFKYCGYDFNERSFDVLRNDLFTVDDNGDYISLEAVGEEF